MRQLLTEIRSAQPSWFSAENKRFFGDVRYHAYRSKSTHEPYLVRETYGWSDMFGQTPRLTFRINAVDPETFQIRSMLDDVFSSLTQAREFVYATE
jgi:hypothetical protein